MQLGPKECLIAQHDSNADAPKMRDVIRRSNILITERKKAEFSNKDIVQDLNRLLKLGSSGNSAALRKYHHELRESCGIHLNKPS